MVNMITAQRAYEINSKAIQTADEMLQMANNVKR
jgi:flagellar basal-body rod protein FlgG